MQTCVCKHLQVRGAVYMPQYWGLEQLKPDRKPTGLLLPITVLKGNLEIFTYFFFKI